MIAERRSTGRVEAGSARRRLRWKRWVFGLPIALVIPFLVLVRLSTWLYLARGVNGWLALGLSAVLASLMLAGVLAAVARATGMRAGRLAIRATLLTFFVYCAYALTYVSAVNVKTDAIRDTYRSLHPVLRVSLSTFIVLDRDAVLTDTERRPGDYVRMGLDVRETSFHYGQADGYVHAVDLRTRGRSPGRNVLTEWYFRSMGFSTLRHNGTADHLHVWLPMRRLE